MAIIFDHGSKWARGARVGLDEFRASRESKSRREAMKAQVELARERLAAAKEGRAQGNQDRERLLGEHAEDRARTLREHAEDREWQARTRARAGQAADLDLNMKSLAAERAARGVDDSSTAIGGMADELESLTEEYGDGVPPEIAATHKARVDVLRHFTSPTEAAAFKQSAEDTFHRMMLPHARASLASEIDAKLREGDLPDEATDEQLSRIAEGLRAGKGDPRQLRKIVDGLQDKFDEHMARTHVKERVSTEILGLLESQDATTGPLTERQKQDLTHIAARVRGGRLDPTEGREAADRVRFGLSAGMDRARRFEQLTKLGVARYSTALKEGLITLEEYEAKLDAFVEQGMEDGGGAEFGSRGSGAAGGGAPNPNGAGGPGNPGPSAPPLASMRSDGMKYYQAVNRIADLRKQGGTREDFIALGQELGVNLDALDREDLTAIQAAEDYDPDVDDESVLDNVGARGAPAGERPLAPVAREMGSNANSDVVQSGTFKGQSPTADSMPKFRAQGAAHKIRQQIADVRDALSTADKKQSSNARDRANRPNVDEGVREREQSRVLGVLKERNDRLSQLVEEYTQKYGELPPDLAAEIEKLRGGE